MVAAVIQYQHVLKENGSNMLSCVVYGGNQKQRLSRVVTHVKYDHA